MLEKWNGGIVPVDVTEWPDSSLTVPAKSRVMTGLLKRVKMAKKGVSLAVGRGEKLPVSQGAGLTAKGRAKYNAATGSNLKAPAPNPKTPKDAARRKSFCARMSGMPGPMKDEQGRPTRKAASLKRWNCK